MIPYVLACACIAIFVFGVGARILLFAQTPMHLRWELYPVPHEGARAAHGGSYLEEIDWWLKPRTRSHLAEMKAMGVEIAFLAALFEHNRPLWRRSFPFHFGIYLVAAATALMGAGGVASLVAPGWNGGALGNAWHWAVLIAGAGGLAVGLLGALGLLHRRLTLPELADYTAPADVFNLLFFVAAFGCALATFALYDPRFALTSRFVENLIALRWQPIAAGAAGWMVGLSAILLALLLAYIPLTHMSHFVGKYFAYHSIRWNDEPNLRGGPREAEIASMLGQKVTWAGSHIEGDGTKSWVDVATTGVKK